MAWGKNDRWLVGTDGTWWALGNGGGSNGSGWALETGGGSAGAVVLLVWFWDLKNIFLYWRKTLKELEMCS